ALLSTSLLHLAPAYASDKFHVENAAHVRAAAGVFVAAFGVGSLIAAISMSLIGDRVRGSRTAIAGILVIGSGVTVLGLTGSFGVGLVAVFLMGLGYVHVTVSLNTSIQLRVAEAFPGRGIAIYLMGLLAGVPIGALVLGSIADAAGLRQMTLACGVLLFAVAAVGIVRFNGMAPVDEALETEL